MKYELPSTELIVTEENNYLKFGEYLNDMQCDDTTNKLCLDDLEYVKELQQENEKLKAELQLYQGALKREHEAIHRVNDLEERIDKAIEYINKYGWQEDIIGGIYTTTGKPVIDRYMRLEWDNCNELLEILKGDSNE